MKWLKSYLTERKQYDCIDGISSSHVTLGSCSIPQGSVIGPLLFLEYINDMQYSSNKLSFIHTLMTPQPHLWGMISETLFRLQIMNY